MKDDKIKKELEEMKNMSPEEFEEAYMQDTVIPTAKDDAEARYIVEHSGADAGGALPNVSKWFDDFIDDFCHRNGIDKQSETKTIFQIVGWKDGITYSAGITAFFKEKDVAEKFAELVKENLLCTIPHTNYDSAVGINELANAPKGTQTVPKRMKDTPYFVRWYVDMRKEKNDEKRL